MMIDGIICNTYILYYTHIVPHYTMSCNVRVSSTLPPPQQQEIIQRGSNGFRTAGAMKTADARDSCVYR